MKIISEILKTKIPFSLAILAIMAMAVNTEQVFLQSMKINNHASNYVASLNSAPVRLGFYPWQANLEKKVAWAGANIPLIPGAKRITFDNGYTARYRVNAPADFVANFYNQILADQGWRDAAKISRSIKIEKLAIVYSENPISKKTDITYTYTPANGANVLGVKIAEADSSAPAPSEQPQQQQPSPDQYQPRPDQPMPSDQIQQQPSPDQYQPRPDQPMPDSQFQSQGPNQPITNQMDFSRQPMPSNDNQNDKQYQPWAGMCSNNTALACVDEAGKFVASAKVGSDGKPVCPENSTAECGNYQQNNQRGQTGPGGQMGQPGQQGPSEQDQQKMDERRFKDMKKGLAQFANGAKMMKRNIARIKTANSKCGVGMPEELENALAQTDNLIGKINSAKTADELDEIVGDVQDVGSVMQDWGPRMGDLSRLCQMLKQADRDIKQFDRNTKRLESQVKSNKKIDLSELAAEYKTAVNVQKETLAQAKELAKTDQDEALAKIEDDFYGNLDNLSNLQMQIDTIVNISKGLKDIAKEINTFASQIKSLTKKKIDTAGLQETLNNLKSQVEEIKNLVKSKADAEELAAKIDEVFNTRQEIQDALEELGLTNNLPKMNSGNNFNVKVNLPGAFIKNENGEAGPDQGMPGANGSQTQQKF